MRNIIWMSITLALLATQTRAQDFSYGVHGGMPYDGMSYDSIGSPVPSASEPLYEYDDLEVWKHGWIQINPYEHGYHSYRPYNYKQVLAQAAQSSVWGMPSTMPYSQSYYLRYGPLTGINGQPIPTGRGGRLRPNDYAPDYGNPSYGNPSDGPPSYGNPGQEYPSYGNPANGNPGYGYPGPTSMNSNSPLRAQPFNMNQTPQQFNNIPGLTQLPGHQFAAQNPAAPNQQVSGDPPRQQAISPTNFQQMHNDPPSGPEFQRQQMQKAQMQYLLQQGGGR